jgi:endonuclease/exonuclease/phosphatase family metal-dependent hydrolase
VAQYQIDDFDFTLITVHLTFADGRTSESARELRSVLDYLDWYFRQPDHDPDVIVCGDFNMPSKLSGQTASGIVLDNIFDSDGRFSAGERRFVVTVHEPTSRRAASAGGGPANNYDHCVLSIDTLEEFVQARRVATNVLTDDPDDPEVRLTSDHFPIIAFFRTRGPGIAPDKKMALRPPLAFDVPSQ